MSNLRINALPALLAGEPTAGRTTARKADSAFLQPHASYSSSVHDGNHSPAEEAEHEHASRAVRACMRSSHVGEDKGYAGQLRGCW